ncbi:MAG: superinfection immunity protein [Richelia sp. RM2_1_2]|nr:superinfection immunity protein [Richelia sp. RM2_1_2]
MEFVFFILFYASIISMVIVLAFLPTIVALYRKHPDRLWIFVVNFGLGGFPLFWILTLVWAFKSNWLIKNLVGTYDEQNLSNNTK